MKMSKIGERVKEMRRILRISQGDLAKKIGVTKQAISNIENSKCMPSMNFLLTVNREYNVNLNYIILGVDTFFMKNDDTLHHLRKSLVSEIERFFDLNGIS